MRRPTLLTTVRGVALASAALVVVALSAGPAAANAAEPGPRLPAARASAAPQAAVNGLAKELNVSPSRARELLIRQDQAHRLLSALPSSLRSRFAGTWFDDTTGRVSVAVDDAGTARQARAAGVAVKMVQRGPRELAALKGEVGQLAKAGVPGLNGYGVADVDNVVEVDINNHERTSATDAFVAAVTRLGSGVRVVESTSSPHPQSGTVHPGDPWWPGSESNCSVAFPVTDPSGAKDFLTAGHCTNDVNQPAYGQSGQQNRIGTSNIGGNHSINAQQGDMGVVAVTEPGWDVSPAVNTYGQPAVTVSGSVDAVVGDNVCHSGNTSHWQCGQVTYVNQTVDYGNTVIDGLSFSTACSLAGDSGGAWLAGDKATGIHSGGPSQCVSNPSKSQDSIFQPVNEALSTFSLTLVTGGGGGGNTVTVTNPGNQTGTVGTPASLQIHASDNPAGGTRAASRSAGQPADVTAACPAPRSGHARCWTLRRSDVSGGTGVRPATPSGYGPSDVQSAYQLPSAGAGTTVAIVDAYDDPNAEKDLATYRQQYGLSACTTANGCFTKVDQRGGTSYPKGDSGWSSEITLDLDAVSAACPKCHLLLVEADDNNDPNLYAADDRAVQLGAKFVSNSWSSAETSGETSTDSHFKVPGVLFAFATGDSGYNGGTQYPASSQYTLAVGGTSLRQGGGSRGWSESAWSGAGSGCSAYEPQPSWQKNVSTGCSHKANSDISALADPQTGLAIYDTYQSNGWAVYGGTSLATPLISAMYALAGTPGSQDNPASYPYAHTGQLNDVTSGSNGSCGAPMCSARTGWDGPTGLGTPAGVSALTPGGGTPPPGSVTVASPGDQTSTVGDPVTLKNSASGGTAPYTWSATGLPAGLSIDASTGTISGSPSTAGTSSVTLTATDSAKQSGAAKFSWTVTAKGGSNLTYAATGLPTGLSIAPASGLISGTPTTAGGYSVTVTATDQTGASGSTTFTWTITGMGGGGTVTVGNPGNQWGYTGYRIFPLHIQAKDSSGARLTFSATGMPAGLHLNARTGTITGTPTRAGSYHVAVTATDPSGASGSTRFGWAVYQGF